MLYHSLINLRVQYVVIASGRAASCHLQPILVVLNRACLNANQLLTSKVTIIYKTLKISQLKDIYNLEVSKTLSYLLLLTIIFNSLQMFIRIIQDK